MTENNFKIDSASISDRGLSKKRPNNEDSYLELNQKGLFAVADGVGGAQAGDVASQMAMEILGEAFSNLKPNEDAEELMKIAIGRANSAIYQMSQDLPQLATMATTIVALHLSGNIGTIGHVGDSRLYRLDEKGNLYRETLDHSVVEEEVRAGRMTVAQAANHPSRNIISRALGADNVVDIDMKTIMFEPSTTFLVCSDGITRHIDDFELRELLASNDTPAQICQKMKEICYERGAEDNLTAVIAKVSSSVAGNAFQKQNGTSGNFEEATVATSRNIAGSANEHANILELDNEVLSSKSERSDDAAGLPPIELDVDQIHLKEKEEVFDRESFDEDQMISSEEKLLDENKEDLSKSSSEELIQEPVILDNPVAPSPPTVRELENKPFEVVEIEENKFWSKALLGIFTFAIGAIIGAGAIYVFMQDNIPTAPVQEIPQKTDNPAQALFEDSRRDIDESPVQYISELEKNPDKNAEDYFLLGRAYMLTGKYAEAKQSFGEARNRLVETDPENADVIANDIAAYLAIVENTTAQKTFSEEIKKTTSATGIPAGEPAENINSNANTPQ